MKKFLIPLILCFPQTLSAQQVVQCGSYAELINLLREKWEESLSFSQTLSDDTSLEFWTGENKTSYTVIHNKGKNLACLLAVGRYVLTSPKKKDI